MSTRSIEWRKPILPTSFSSRDTTPQLGKIPLFCYPYTFVVSATLKVLRCSKVRGAGKSYDFATLFH